MIFSSFYQIAPSIFQMTSPLLSFRPTERANLYKLRCASRFPNNIITFKLFSLKLWGNFCFFFLFSFCLSKFPVETMRQSLRFGRFQVLFTNLFWIFSEKSDSDVEASIFWSPVAIQPTPMEKPPMSRIINSDGSKRRRRES